MNRVIFWIFAAAVTSALACSGSATSALGEEGRNCYPNNTCNASLVCVQGVCRAGFIHDAAPAPDSEGPAPDSKPGLDGSQPPPPDAGPVGCVPDEIFCRDDKVRRCSDDGNTSVLLADCPDRYGPGFQCVECPEGIVCQAPSIIVTAKSTGLLSFDVQAYPGACEGQSSASARFSSVGQKLFTLSVAPTSGQEKAVINQNYEMVSGQAYSLRKDPKVFSVHYYTATGTHCSSNWTGPSIVEPPSPGTVVATFAGKDPGDLFSVSASGYLTCDYGKTWAPFSLSASGPLTP